MAKITYRTEYTVYVLGIAEPFKYNSTKEFYSSVKYHELKDPKTAITIYHCGAEIYTTAFTIKKQEFSQIQ